MRPIAALTVGRKCIPLSVLAVRCPWCTDIFPLRISLLFLSDRISLLAQLSQISLLVRSVALVYLYSTQSDSDFAISALVVPPDRLHCLSTITGFKLLFVLPLLVVGLEHPMGDYDDDQVEWMGSRPNDLTAPPLRGIENAFLQGHTLEVVRDSVTVRVINGVDQHTNTSQ